MDTLDINAQLALTASVMRDQTPLAVNISIGDTWLLISGIQLAASHPSLGQATKDELTRVGREFQRAIVDVHPEAADLLEKGWHREHDVRIKR